MEGLNNKKGKDSAVNNVVNKEASVADEIDYSYDDLSSIDTATLKMALTSYRNFNKDNEALVRIEAELLSRKELEVDENLFSAN